MAAQNPTTSAHPIEIPSLDHIGVPRNEAPVPLAQIFRQIPTKGADGYLAGDQGGILSNRSPNGRGTGLFLGTQIFRRMTLGRSQWGHQVVSLQLRRRGKRFAKTYRVHRLVLETFVGPCPPGMEGCHSPDRDPTNNRLENLRWDTKKANAYDQYLHGTRAIGERNGRSKLTEADIQEILRLRASGLKMYQIAEEIGRPVSTIYAVLRGHTWKHLVTKEPRRRRPRVPQDVKARIRRLKADGWRVIDIAKEVGLGSSTVSIICGKTTFPKTITANGATRTIAEWADFNGLTITAIRCRLKRGYTPEEAVEPGAYKPGVKTRTLKDDTHGRDIEHR